MLHPIIKCGLQSAVLIAPIKLKFKYWNNIDKPIAPSLLGHFVACTLIEYTSILATNYESHSSKIINTGVSVAGAIKTSIIAGEVVTDPLQLASGIFNAMGYYHRPNLKTSIPKNKPSFTENLFFGLSPMTIEFVSNVIASKEISKGIEAGAYLSFSLFPAYYAVSGYLEDTSFGNYSPSQDILADLGFFAESAKTCSLQTATIIAPVFAAVTAGVEMGLKNNRDIQFVAHATYLNIASNSAAHFTKCMAVSYAKTASDSPVYHTALDTVAGSAKYAMVDYLHPEKEVNIARIISGSWNGLGYNIGNSPFFIEGIDCLIESFTAGEEDLVIPTVIGSAAGVLISLSMDYLYMPALEYINSENEIVGNITEVAHEEL